MDEERRNRAVNDEIGEHRDRTAEDRDQRADAHDQASEARDDRAAARDERAEARELSADTLDRGAAADRAGALRDRKGGASDRSQAADDRDAASDDRESSARDRAESSVDALTGVYRREPGIAELQRELARARRLQHPFALAFVDVDDLKVTNDSLGHGAGDRLLRAVADAIATHLRPYDVIVRYGGDEFVCGLPDVTLSDVAERFELANAALEASQQASVTVGLGELAADDTLEDLIARADAALYAERRATRSTDGA